MDSDRWNRLQGLFAQALALPAAAREAHLQACCDGDAELLRQVQALLAHDAADEATVERLVQSEAGAVLGAAASPRTGERYGAWEIIDHLGQGGMGAVYRARRADGAFEQPAALKLLNPGLLGADSRHRLEAERQILAGLNHPYIARLIDGGTSTTGVPYLVMELVDGVPIDAHCAQAALDTRARLRLFLRVCEAVDFAHRNLVVHRDIKPSNLLVTADGTPKLLDFGISKLLDGADPGLTATEQRLFTPAHASPEQIGGGAITTATDVYALGVLLYLLLAGRLPFAAAGRTSAQLAADILHRTPQPPSLQPQHQLPRGGAEGPMPAPPWPRALARDLDAIVLMALRKEPDRRYASVQALRDDIERVLAHRPVRARPDAWTYRASRFLRRHSLASGAAAVAATVSVGFVATLLLQAQRIEREREVATQTADFMVELFTAANPTSPSAPDLTARQLLREGAARVQRELGDAPEVRARLLRHIGAALASLGELTEAENLLRQAIALLRTTVGSPPHELPEAYMDLADTLRLAGRSMAALEALDQAWALEVRARPADDPALAEHQMTRAGVLWAAGRHAEAGEAMSRAVAMLEQHPPSDMLAVARANLALVGWELGRFRQARAEARQALALQRQRYREPHVYIAATLNLLGSLERRLGAPDQAHALYRQALAQREAVLGPDHPEVANDLRYLADSEREWGRPVQAQALVARALQICEQAGEPAAACTAETLLPAARIEHELGRHSVARAQLARAIGIFERQHGESHGRIALALEQLAAIDIDTDQPGRALAPLQRALSIRTAALGDAGPWAAATMDQLALAQARLGALDEALALSDRARLLRGPPSDDPTAAAQGLVVRAEVQQRRGDAADALHLLRAARLALRSSHGDSHQLTRDVQRRIELLEGSATLSAGG